MNTKKTKIETRPKELNNGQLFYNVANLFICLKNVKDDSEDVPTVPCLNCGAEIRIDEESMLNHQRLHIEEEQEQIKYDIIFNLKQISSLFC